MAVVLYVVQGIAWGLADGWHIRLLVSPFKIVHATAIVIGAVILLALRRGGFRPWMLRFLDADGLYLAVATTLVISAMLYTDGLTHVPAILALFIIARAIVVPSTGRTTFLLALPAPLGLLALQLWHGKTYFVGGDVVPSQYFTSIVLMDQGIVWMGIGVATVASRVGFSLREKVREAQQLGQYRLERKLGEGGMGEVYRATHAMLRRPTAIKLLRPELTGVETLQRFEREVRETSRLQHPNTVHIYDYGRTADGVFYYAMEYLDGADLEEIVKKKGPVSPARAIHVLRQACAALQEAHAAGLVHRDIKPGNLVLCRRGGEHDVVKVVDFGLVKDLKNQSASLTQLGSICGTPETLAPEVLGGAPATAAADLYALGVVGCYLLTGRPIFDAKSPAEFIAMHITAEPIAPSQRHDGVPADLEAVLLRCLKKEPADRYASAAELDEALAQCVDANRWNESLANAWWEHFRR